MLGERGVPESEASKFKLLAAKMQVFVVQQLLVNVRTEWGILYEAQTTHLRPWTHVLVVGFLHHQGEITLHPGQCERDK